MSRSKQVGTTAETAVVRYLRTHGWPHAERRALAGAQDLGDITGTPGLVWEVKSGRAAEQASDGLIANWLAETEAERRNATADLGVLVTKRSGYGPSRAGAWWAHVDLSTLTTLLRGRLPLTDTLATASARMHLEHLVPLLHASGYGSPLEIVPSVEVVL